MNREGGGLAWNGVSCARRQAKLLLTECADSLHLQVT